MPTQVLTVMFTDIKEFTQRTSSTSRESLRQLLDKYEELMLPVIASFEGKLIKTIGDALLVTFVSPTNAVLCGVMIQEKLKEHNETHPDEKLEIRVALNSGEIEIRDDDVFGEAVNIAARIEGLTDAGEIFFTEAVYLAMNKAEVPSSEIGYKRLKGVPEAIKVYRVIQDPHSEDFQKLIARLRGMKFGKVDLPQTKVREIPEADKGKFPHKLLLMTIPIVIILILYLWSRPSASHEMQKVKRAIDNGNHALAMSLSESMLTTYPQDPLSFDALKISCEAEARYLIKISEFSEARKRIDFHQKQRPGLDLTHLWYEIGVGQSAYMIKNGYWLKARELQNKILEKAPDRLDLHQSFLTQLHEANLDIGHLKRHEKWLAYKIASLGKGPLDEMTGPRLAQYLFDVRPTSQRAANITTWLKRYPGSRKLMLGKFYSDKTYERIHAGIFLKSDPQLSEKERFRHHLINATTLSTSYMKHLQDSFAWLENKSKEANWSKLTKDLKVDKVKIFDYYDDRSKAANKRFAALFLDPLIDQVKAWVHGESGNLRSHAKLMLEDAGKASLIDVKRYHAQTLLSGSPYWLNDDLKAAFAYYRSIKDKKEITKAIENLSAFEKRIVTAVAYEKSRKRKYNVKAGEKRLAETRGLIGELKSKI